MSDLNKIVDFLTTKKNVMEEEVDYLGKRYIKADGEYNIPVFERAVKHTLLHEIIEEIKHLVKEPEPKETLKEEPEDLPVPDSPFYHINTAFGHDGYHVRITGQVDPTKEYLGLNKYYVVATISNDRLGDMVKLHVKVDNIYDDREVRLAESTAIARANRYIKFSLEDVNKHE